MKEEDYLKILQESLKSLVGRLGFGRTCEFQQNNDPKQTSEVVKEWISHARIEVLERPFQSPDLNLLRTSGLCLRDKVIASKL